MFAVNQDELKHDIKLHYTARIMPEDQNTGGFFIALLKKNKPTSLIKTEDPIDPDRKTMHVSKFQSDPMGDDDKPFKEELKITEKNTNVEEDQKAEQKPDLSQFHLIQEKDQAKYEFVPKVILDHLIKVFGISPDFPSHLLVIPNETGRRIYILSEKIASLLHSDKDRQLNAVYFGTTVFKKNRHFTCPEDTYRLSNNGIRYIYPFITKNLIFVNRKEFNFLIRKGHIIYVGEIEEAFPESHKKFTELQLGSYCAVFKEEGLAQDELFTLQKMANSVVVTVPKEDINGLRIKYTL
jgi:tRNA (cytosine34-C5)-methyltransferase